MATLFPVAYQVMNSGSRAMRSRRELERHVVSLEQRVRELRDQSARVAQDLIESAGERRRGRSPHVDRMLRRVHAEVTRLEEEAGLSLGETEPEALERHVQDIEHQLQDVLTEREEWMRESLLGFRRRAEDLRTLDWLREEQDRLTAELLRCARLLQKSSAGGLTMRRVWKVLRLSGA